MNIMILISLMYIYGITELKDDHNLYEHCAVTSELPEASKIGVEILKKGGNSVDAAIATCLAIGVVNSFSSGLGGGGFILIKPKGLDKEAIMIDFREKAPMDFNVNEIIKDKWKSSYGGTSVAVPSEIKGLYEAHKKYGKLKWEELFDGSINLCKGFRISKELSKRIQKFKREILADKGLSEIYSRNGEVLKEGDICERPNYKRTLEYLKNNPDGFYQGEIVDALVNCINKRGGHISKEDFAINRPITRKSLTSKYKNFTIFTTNLPSSGILIIEALKLMEKFNFREMAEKYEKEGKFPHIHILIEIYKFVMAKRGVLGDPLYVKNEEAVINALQNQKNIEDIYKKIKLEKTLSVGEYKGLEYNVVDHGTTHINVVDEDDLFVSLTSTINLEFGAKFMDPVTGVILNNQIDDFYFPNNEAELENSKHIPNLANRTKIPLSSASPLILESKDATILLGAAGGIRIPTSILEVLFWLDVGKNLEDAIAMPRLHHQFSPNVVYVEDTEDDVVIKYLESIGHKVEKSQTNAVFTSVQGAFIKYVDNSKLIHAVSDKRKGGLSAGY